MFIHILETHTNYFVLTKGKTLQQIYQEIILRMNKNYIPPDEKRNIMTQISKQLNN